VVTTRWADEDLVTYLKRNEDYREFNLPAITEAADGTEKFMFPGLFSEAKLYGVLQEDGTRKGGLKKRLGPYMFSCLYLNKPMDLHKRLFQAKWFNYIAADMAPTQGFTSVAIDPAISERDESCETAITAVQHVPMINGVPRDELLTQHIIEGDLLENHQYWWAAEHAHMLPSEQVTKTVDLAEWMNKNVAPLKGIIVETVAYQAVLKYLIEDELKRRGLHFDMIAHGTRTNKDIRIQGLQPFFYQNIIHFIKSRLPDSVESQLIQYPHEKLVDIIDCFTLHKPMYKYSNIYTEKHETKSEAEDILDFIIRNRKKAVPDAMTMSTEWDHIETLMDTGMGEQFNQLRRDFYV